MLAPGAGLIFVAFCSGPWASFSVSASLVVAASRKCCGFVDRSCAALQPHKALASSKLRCARAGRGGCASCTWGHRCAAVAGALASDGCYALRGNAAVMFNAVSGVGCTQQRRRVQHQVCDGCARGFCRSVASLQESVAMGLTKVRTNSSRLSTGVRVCSLLRANFVKSIESSAKLPH